MGIDQESGVVGHYHRLSNGQLSPYQRFALRNESGTNPLDFFAQLKKAANTESREGEGDSEAKRSGPSAAEMAAFIQSVRTQMNNSIFRMLSSEDTENPSEGVFPMENAFTAFPEPIQSVPIPSNVRQVMSEKAIYGSGDIEDIIKEAAEMNDVDPDLIRGVIHAESNFNPEARSPMGAMGLMQLMPETAKDLGVGDPFDPKANVLGGTRYLKQLLDRYDGNMTRALAAYNWGMGNLESSKGRLPIETRNYVSKITKFYLESKSAIA